jgi:3-hydroxyacyl-[acyl-carrier-protein] dehydratase
MPPPSLIDLSTVDLSRRIVDRDSIYTQIPHRHEFMLLHGILHMDLEAGVAVGIQEVRPEDWWARGHIPGRPLLPGVLMIEAAAQLASYCMVHIFRDPGFVGFIGLDKVKFRDTVTPPADLIVINKIVSAKAKRFVIDAQEFVGRKMVFEGRITGMVM